MRVYKLLREAGVYGQSGVTGVSQGYTQGSTIGLSTDFWVKIDTAKPEGSTSQTPQLCFVYKGSSFMRIERQ